MVRDKLLLSKCLKEELVALRLVTCPMPSLHYGRRDNLWPIQYLLQTPRQMNQPHWVPLGARIWDKICFLQNRRTERKKKCFCILFCLSRKTRLSIQTSGKGGDTDLRASCWGICMSGYIRVSILWYGVVKLSGIALLSELCQSELVVSGHGSPLLLSTTKRKSTKHSFLQPKTVNRKYWATWLFSSSTTAPGTGPSDPTTPLTHSALATARRSRGPLLASR